MVDIFSPQCSSVQTHASVLIGAFLTEWILILLSMLTFNCFFSFQDSLHIVQ